MDLREPKIAHLPHFLSQRSVGVERRLKANKHSVSLEDSVNHCARARAGTVERGKKKKITLKISLKSGNHALPQEFGGVQRGNAYKLNQPEEEYICFRCMP